MALQSNLAYTGFRSGVAGFAYNEKAFAHFLAIERRRAEHSLRPIVLVLVSVQPKTRGRLMGPGPAAALFSRLGTAIREVDFVGWYREGRIAAAVLIQHTTPPDDVCERVADRFRHALNSQAIPADMPSLRVRVMRLRGERATVLK